MDCVREIESRHRCRSAGACASLLLALALLGVALIPATAMAQMTRLNTGSFGAFQSPQDVAVDQSNGDVYVLDTGEKTVSRFSSSLVPKNFTALNTNVIDGHAATLCTGSPSPNCDQAPFNGFSFGPNTAGQVAVDSSGSPFTNGQIYITDSAHRLVSVFAPSGAYVGSLSHAGASGPAFGEVCGVATDSSGAAYIGDFGRSRVYKFAPTSGTPSNSDFVTEFTTTQPCRLAVGEGDTEGALFVSRLNGAVNKYFTNGTRQHQLTSGQAGGVAVDPSTGYVLVTFAGEVTELDSSSEVSSFAVGAFGAPELVNGRGIAVDGDREVAYVPEASGKVLVYGPITPPTEPAVALGAHISPSQGGAGLVGYIESGGLASTYYFEYGTEDCATSTCIPLPSSVASVPKGLGPARVVQNVSGLAPETTYHYRLVATNTVGTSSAATTFSTLAGFVPADCTNSPRREEQEVERLPECRAYELVSAIPERVRNGADVFVSSQRVRAAADGGAFQFTSLAGAGDVAGVPGSAEYIAVRKSTGWFVHGVTPGPPRGSAASLLGGRESRYMGSFTADLSKAVFRSNAPLTGEGANVQEVTNLYRREDMLTPGAGTYRLLSDAVTPQSPHPAGQSSGAETEVPSIAGASSNLDTVLFETPRRLTSNAAGLGTGPKLYKWANGVIDLVGILPASEGGVPSISQAGRGARHYSPHVISGDGSRVLFATPPFDSAGTGSRLYLRDDHGTEDTSDDTTARVDASEKTNGSGPGGADPRGPQPATFWDAAGDTTLIFFTSTEALTNDALSANEPKLYRYDLNAPSGSRLTLLSIDDNVGDGITQRAEGAIGVSEDGSYVYFVSTNQLVNGLPTTPGSRIFVWHGGTVEQVGAINGGAEQNAILGSDAWQGGDKWSRVSSDGKRLIFATEGTNELVGYNHGTACPSGPTTRCRQIYLYVVGEPDRTPRLSCVSCRGGGQAAAGDADIGGRDLQGLGMFLVGGDRHLGRALPDNGPHVFFTTTDRLSPDDENLSADVYGFNADTGLRRLLSGGKPNTPSVFMDASDDGGDVFFTTRSSLLPGDRNENIDVYNARAGGGFAEPPLVASDPCESAASCRPATPGGMATLAPESARLLPSTGGPRLNRRQAAKRRQVAKRRKVAKRRQAAKRRKAAKRRQAAHKKRKASRHRRPTAGRVHNG